MAIDSGTSVTTRLLTLLNVSATKAGKRKRAFEEAQPTERLNKRRAVQFGSPEEAEGGKDKDEAGVTEEIGEESELAAEPQVEEAEEQEGDAPDIAANPYEEHFGLNPPALTQNARDAVDRHSWTMSKSKQGRLGAIVETVPEGSNGQRKASTSTALTDELRKTFQSRQAKLPREVQELQNDMLSLLTSHHDLYVTRSSSDTVSSMRETIALHAINHISRKRRRVLRNNERLAHAAKAGAPPPEDVQDQGFTRPSVLILLPFRSFALRWLAALTAHTPSPAYQIENRARFESEYGLPPGAVDKLVAADPGTYPRDHVDMFAGNVDDSFRVGVKYTRKSVKLFTEFYGADLIIASPLGLRMSIEKEDNADFLSSIELLVVDQMDALTMQNWEHVQFVMSHLNQLPKDSHNADFSRIKPWYLDGHASYLRQSVLLTAYETPEIRAMFHSFKNIAGKVRTERRWAPVEVPEGIDQNFVHFTCSSAKDEADKRFQHFTTQVLPPVLKSAVKSVQTVVFVPSSFDFIRVQNYFRKNLGVSFAELSEYTSNQDISRARQAFFSGKKQFLLVSERFHFFRRYKIRGIRNLLFYGPPDHPQFYTEFLSYPFLDDGVDASDVTCQVLYSKYDWLRLERIAGTEGAAELIKRV